MLLCVLWGGAAVSASSFADLRNWPPDPCHSSEHLATDPAQKRAGVCSGVCVSRWRGIGVCEAGLAGLARVRKGGLGEGRLIHQGAGAMASIEANLGEFNQELALGVGCHTLTELEARFRMACGTAQVATFPAPTSHREDPNIPHLPDLRCFSEHGNGV